MASLDLHSSRQIKRLLRRTSTEEFITEDGWTRNPQEAKIFVDALEAAEVVTRQGLTGVELTLRVEVSGSDLFCVALR